MRFYSKNKLAAKLSRKISQHTKPPKVVSTQNQFCNMDQFLNVKSNMRALPKINVIGMLK